MMIVLIRIKTAPDGTVRKGLTARRRID